MKVLIVDDDEIQRRILTKMCQNAGVFDDMVELESAVELLNYLEKESADVVLLDIHMPNFSGIDFIKAIKDRPSIIFITGDKEFALEAFEYDALDYLIKPVEFPRFLKAISKVKDRISSEANQQAGSKNYLFAKVDSRLVKFDFDDILYLEAKGDYVSLVTLKKSYLIHTTLKKITADLVPDLFQQTHRSYVVNISKIKDIEGNTILLHDAVIPIGRSLRADFLAKLGLGRSE